jgi:dTDP-4-amino-4,6-dideoxygalactose transaminase
MKPHEQLEKEFGDWLGNPNCVAVSSGTAALHLALEAIGAPRGCGVALPDLTMVACARAVSMAGMHPIFLDCHENLLVPEHYHNRVSAPVRMVVHVYGRVCRYTDNFYRRYHVVEDMAEAHGIKPHPESAAACWSFYKNKIVHGEEGGMIAFKSPAHADKARCLRSLGFTPAHDFQHVPRGVNARLADLLAVPILDSMGKMESNLRERARVVAHYDKFIPVKWRMPWRDVGWVYDFRINGMNHTQQDFLVKSLRNRGIEARHCFKPMSRMKEYTRGYGVEPTVADVMAREVVYLPVYPDMTLQQVEVIIGELLALAKEASLI